MLPPYQQAAKELLEAIPDLADLPIQEAYAKIDSFCETWRCKSISFNPYSYWSIVRHAKQYPMKK
jgi:hypothetical protein